MVMTAPGSTSVACLACTKLKTRCSFVSDRKEAKGKGKGKVTGTVPTGAKKAKAKASSSGAKAQESRSPSVLSPRSESESVFETLGMGDEVDALHRSEIEAKEALEEANKAMVKAAHDLRTKERAFIKAVEGTKLAMMKFARRHGRSVS